MTDAMSIALSREREGLRDTLVTRDYFNARIGKEIAELKADLIKWAVGTILVVASLVIAAVKLL